MQKVKELNHVDCYCQFDSTMVFNFEPTLCAIIYTLKSLYKMELKIKCSTELYLPCALELYSYQGCI